MRVSEDAVSNWLGSADLGLPECSRLESRKYSPTWALPSHAEPQQGAFCPLGLFLATKQTEQNKNTVCCGVTGKWKSLQEYVMIFYGK